MVNNNPSTWLILITHYYRNNIMYIANTLRSRDNTIDPVSHGQTQMRSRDNTIDPHSRSTAQTVPISLEGKAFNQCVKCSIYYTRYT